MRGKGAQGALLMRLLLRATDMCSKKNIKDAKAHEAENVRRGIDTLSRYNSVIAEELQDKVKHRKRDAEEVKRDAKELKIPVPQSITGFLNLRGQLPEDKGKKSDRLFGAPRSVCLFTGECEARGVELEKTSGGRLKATVTMDVMAKALLELNGGNYVIKKMTSDLGGKKAEMWEEVDVHVPVPLIEVPAVVAEEGRVRRSTRDGRGANRVNRDLGGAG